METSKRAVKQSSRYYVLGLVISGYSGVWIYFFSMINNMPIANYTIPFIPLVLGILCFVTKQSWLLKIIEVLFILIFFASPALIGLLFIYDYCKRGGNNFSDFLIALIILLPGFIAFKAYQIRVRQKEPRRYCLDCQAANLIFS